MNKTENYPPVMLSWTVWGLGAILYLIGFYQRVAPAVMTSELMMSFDIGAAGLGNLSGIYFYSYVAMQVPTGILADRWGPRRLLSAGALGAGAGTLVFAMAPSLMWAGMGRLLIGGSVAVAFVAMLKLAVHWFAPRQFALASGMALFCGIIGAVFAGVPLRHLVSEMGWRPVMLTSGVVTLAVAGLIWMLVRDDPGEKGYTSYAYAVSGMTPRSGFMTDIKEIFKHRNPWLLCFIPGGIVGSVLTFSGLWGVPFLTTHYGLSQAGAAALCSTLLVAWAVGGPVFGALSDRMGRRKPLYVSGCIIGVLAWLIIHLCPWTVVECPHASVFMRRIFLRLHDNRFCLFQGICSIFSCRHCFRHLQHGGNARPHDPSAGCRAHSGSSLARPHGRWYQAVQSRCLPAWILPYAGLAHIGGNSDPVY